MYQNKIILSLTFTQRLEYLTEPTTVKWFTERGGMNAIKFETTRPLLHFIFQSRRRLSETRLTGHAWSWHGRSGNGGAITNRLPALGEGIKREEICNSLYALHFQFFRCYYCE